MLDNILSIMIFAPILAGLVLLLVPVGKDAARAVGLVVSTIVVLLSLKLFFTFSGVSGTFEFVQKISLIDSLGISYSLGVDGISLLVLMAAAALFPMVYLLFTSKEKGYYANLLIVQGAMIGAICASDMVLFYISMFYTPLKIKLIYVQ